jgi:uncharacterized integral membrane protein (TIGR00697 family)
MINEIIFIFHASLLSIFLLVALRLGKEALITLICLYGVLANLFVTKQITLFNLDATASDAFAVAAILGLNILQEYFGAVIAQRTIWISFFTLITYTIASQLHLWYAPSTLDYMHGHFCALLEVMPRITIASITVFLIVQILDRWLYAKLQNMCGTRYFLIRNYASLLICQLIDTILFSFLGLWGIVGNIWHIIIVSYMIKLVSITLTTPWLSLSTKFKMNS